MTKKDLLINAPKRIQHTLFLAHGAGAPMDSAWMNDLTKALVSENIKVIRFEFPYMQERRNSEKKRPPNTNKQLQQCWHEVLDIAKVKTPFSIGGKSMGGRVASQIIDETQAKNLIALGFPFHAPSKAMGDRLADFLSVKKPGLILQGERDTFGTQAELQKLKFPRNKKFIFLADGDHSFKPRKSSGLTLQEHLQTAAETIAKYLTR